MAARQESCHRPLCPGLLRHNQRYLFAKTTEMDLYNVHDFSNEQGAFGCYGILFDYLVDEYFFFLWRGSFARLFSEKLPRATVLNYMRVDGYITML
jgi:hypothetical protein